MRLLLSSLFLAVSLFGDTYYARVEPLEKYQIMSSASGEVVFANENAEGKLKTGTIVKIDDFLDKEELKKIKNQINYVSQTLSTSKKSLENLLKIAKLQRENFEKFKEMSTKSKVDKDRELFQTLNYDNAVLGQREKIISLESQLADLNYRVKYLKKSISNKNPKLDNLYVYKLHIRKGEFVNFGTPLYEAYDVSASKLFLLLNKDDFEKVKDKKVLKTDTGEEFKIVKVWTIADSSNISSYKVELHGKAQSRFSDLVKFEIK